MMKQNAFYRITQLSLRTLLPTLFLCGFLFNLLDGMHGPKAPAGIKPLSEKQAIWSKFLGYSPQENTSELSGFTQDGTTIFVKQTKRVIALDANTGYTRWRRNLNYALTSCASAHAKRVFITTAEPRLLALDTQSGEVVWSYKLPHTVLAKAAADQRYVIVKTIAGEVLAFNVKNGKLLWRHKQPAPSMMLQTSSAPQLVGNQAIIGFPNGKLIAYDITSGEVLWEHTVKQTTASADFDQLVDIAADPLVDKSNGVVYIGTYHGMLQCLSLKTGDMKWERPFSGYMPLVLGKYLYAIDDSYTVYAFKKSDGSIVWQQDIFKEYKTSFYHYGIIGPTLTHQGKLLTLGDQASNIYWLDAETGNIIKNASFRIASPILTVPLAKDNTVYVMNRRSQVAAWKNPEIVTEVKA